MKAMNTLLSIAIAAMMISGAFMVLAPTAVAKSTTVVDDPDPLDLGYKIREQMFDPSLLSQNGNTVDEAVPGDYWVVGNVAKYYVGSYGSSYYKTPATSFMWFTMRADGENCELWTADDMLFPVGDPRNAQTSRLTITDAQAQYMIGQFDNDIFPVETEYFCAAPPLDGSDSYFESVGQPESRLFRTHDPGKVMIMVFNIVDENYWNSSYPYMTVGFFSPTLEYYYARNIINIDVWDWANRTGPQPLNPSRSYLYESTVAHEYQHLLHNYVDPQEDTWINEGCAMYAQMLCGYGVPDSDIAHYLYTPSNALTVWADQGDINILADYGAAALFMIYMNDHFGGAAFISGLMQSAETGTEGITSTLFELGYWQWTYPSVFKAWRLANLIRADTPGNGLYNYESVDLDEIQALGICEYSEEDGYVLASEFLGPAITMEGLDTGVDTLNAYSVDYIKVTDFASMSKTYARFFFDGQDKVYTNNWYIDTVEGLDYWYSGTGIDIADQKLIASLSLGDAPVFEFDTMWELEEFWDFGFVQVSTNMGTSWTSLEYEYTTYDVDPSAINTVVDNLPGVTGFSDGLTHIRLDLSAYANQNVLVSFRYVTDWGYTENGWWVNNFMLDGVELPLEMFLPQYENVDFTVSMYFPATDVLPARITEVPIFRVTETGFRYLAWFSGYTEAYILVSPNNGPVDYSFGIASPVGGDPPPEII